VTFFSGACLAFGERGDRCREILLFRAEFDAHNCCSPLFSMSRGSANGAVAQRGDAADESHHRRRSRKRLQCNGIDGEPLTGDRMRSSELAQPLHTVDAPDAGFADAAEG
ncbi:hypothetical protein, partial [Nocardia salmonicida]